MRKVRNYREHAGVIYIQRICILMYPLSLGVVNPERAHGVHTEREPFQRSKLYSEGRFSLGSSEARETECPGGPHGIILERASGKRAAAGVPSMPNAMGGTHLHTPQSIFQPTMSHTGPQNEPQWLSMPQVPAMTIPWSMPSFQQPDLVRFTGQKPLQSFNPFLHQKRKLETPDVVDTRPSKQFITEEKMAQHFQGLYISPNNSPMATAQESASSPPVASSSCDIEASSSLDIDENISQPRLVISDEIKRLQQEPILPTQLLSKLERPTMALVLWEPPSKHLPILAQRDLPIPFSSEDNNNRNVNNSNNNSTDNNNDNNSINNNNEIIPNLNQTMDVNTSYPILEPMDL